MKNNFLQEAYGGLTEARSKHYCLGLPRKWKVMTSTLLLLFTFAIGNVWAQTFRYYIAISNADATGISSGAVRVFKTSDDVNFVNVSDQFTLNSEYSTSSAGSVYYRKDTKTYSTSSDNAIFRGPRYTKNKTFTINWTNSNLSFSKITFEGVGTNSATKTLTIKNSSSDAGSVVQFPKSSSLGTYECTKDFSQENGITIVSANDQPAYAITILHAVDHAEITSTATEMVTSESLQMEGWPSGGTWSIAEGGTGTGSITAGGILTATANGTIKVKYAKDGYGDDIKTITVSDSRTIHWFAAGNTDAATNEVSNNTSFFSFNTTSTSDQSGNITIGSKTYSLTKRLNAEQTTWSFTIPSNTTGTLNVVAISSGGSDRTLTMQKAGESGTVELGSTTNQKNAWSLITKVDIPAGTYTVSSDGNVRFGMMRMIINKTEPAVVGAYTVTAATSTGTNTYGTVSAGASSLDATETTTITASPATGYRVTNWAVADEDHGASIDPAGESNSNTTTLTMGTANATVTVTFGLIDYTVEKTLTNCAVKDGSTAIPATMNYGDDLSTIIEPTTGNILPSSISVTGVTSYTWNASTGALTLTDVTGNVSISIEAAAPQTGSGAITYALVTSGETAATYSAGTFTGILSSGTPSLNTLGASNTLTGGNGVGVQSDKNTPKSSRTAGITSSTADFNAASSPYAEFTFSVLDGYTFTPTAISVPVLAISNNAYFTAIVTDGSSTWTSTTAECTQGAQATINVAPSGGSALTGTVNIRVFCHNQATEAKGFRFGTGSVTITGTVIAAGACTPPTIAWDGDQPADAFVSDGSKTFTVTSNYAAGIDFELSSNTCGATVAVEPETGNLHWVVSFTGAGSVTITPKVVGDGSIVCAETVSATAKTLTVAVGHDVTFNMNGHGTAISKQTVALGGKATEPNEPSAMGYNFGGWFKEAGCENAWDFATDVVNDDTELFAKWTAFVGCTELWPATSGDAPTAADQEIVLQSGSTGGHIYTVSAKSGKFNESFEYTMHGLALKKGGDDVISVVLGNDMAANTKISVTLVAANTGARGLNLLNGTGGSVKGGTTLGWADATVGAVKTFSYTVEAGDGLDGTNIFRLQRSNSVYLKCVKVESCGASVTYHDLTSAVNIAGKGTVTLGASSVREGYTTTATYSDIDPLYEFVNWTVSGAGASIADASANPATFTMGTEDAVVTLNLRLIPVKFTVEYYDGATLMGSEQVAVNENPTASEIVTAKRHYTFLGWSDTDGGDVVALNTITRTEAGTVKLYAKYEAVVCPTSGTIFSMAAKANELDADLQPNGNTIISLEPYATISGGEAKVGNFGGSKHIKISKGTSVIQFTGSNAFMYMLLDCQLQEGDTIKLGDTEKFTLSIDSLKTKKADIAKNTHFYVVPSEWAGADTILVWRNGNNVSFSSLQVIRPAKYTVTFDMKDHGSAIADITNVIEGSKISAPTAPTDAAYSFAGWYKENTLENEWDFDVDVVTDNITLYAKWLDKSDATLKSLKYGSTEIELQAGVYTYAVELPSLTTSVPALTAETSNPNASTVITDDDAFDGEGHASSTVEVTPEKEGAAHQTYTVNFTKLPSMPLLDVDNSIVWNFGNAGTQNNAFTDEVLANFPGVTNNATFRAQTLKATGAKIKEGYLQGTPILFHATKAGLLRVEFANTGGGTRPYRYLVVNGERTAYKSNNTTHVTTAWIEVPAGDVTIEGECVEDANGACTSDNLNFYKIEFLALAYTRDDDWMAPGELGTICYPEGLVAVGADMYQMAGVDENNKFVFDEVSVLEPGKPYLFEAQANVLKFYATTETAASKAGTSNGMVGTFSDTILSHTDARAAKCYYFSGTKFYAVSKRTTDLSVPANRAYVDLNESHPAGAPKQGVRRITFNVDGMNAATGMDELNASETPVKMLIDGQLFILRGEKMYNANGQLVK